MTISVGLGAFEGMTSRQVYRIIVNADQQATRRRDPAWVFVRRIFGVGSTVARNLCTHAGIDPDESVTKRSKDNESQSDNGVIGT